MIRTHWLVFRKGPKINPKVVHPQRPMEGRVVLCADCNVNRTLTVTSSGNLICSTCGSEHWMFIGVSLAARLSAHNQASASERLAVDRYIARLEKASLQLAASASRPGP